MNPTDIGAFIEFLDYMQRTAADRDVNSTEMLQARMWAEFLPAALTTWTTAGVLEQIAEQLAGAPKEDADDE
jgi:hypothetical protein